MKLSHSKTIKAFALTMSSGALVLSFQNCTGFNSNFDSKGSVNLSFSSLANQATVWVDKPDASLAQFPGGSISLAQDAAALSAAGAHVLAQGKTLRSMGPALPVGSDRALNSSNRAPSPAIASGLQNSFVIAASEVAIAQSLGFVERSTYVVEAKPCAGADALLAFGQSNSANSGQVADTSSDDRVLMFFNGYCFPARDPLLGASIWNGGGSLWMPLAKAYVNDHPGKQIVIISIGVGGSTIAEWANGGVWNPRLTSMLAQINGAGLNVIKVFLHQGETDAINHTTHDQYASQLENVFQTVHTSLPNSPFSIGIASYFSSLPYVASPDIKRAQLELVAKHYPQAEVGVVSDIFPINYRATNLNSDDVHFTALGLQTVANAWYQVSLSPTKPAPLAALSTAAFESLMLRAPSANEAATFAAQLPSMSAFASAYNVWSVLPEAFLRQQYTARLKRVPELDGFSYWMATLASGTSQPSVDGQLSSAAASLAAGSLVYDHNLFSYDSANVMLRPNLNLFYYDPAQGLWVSGDAASQAAARVNAAAQVAAQQAAAAAAIAAQQAAAQQAAAQQAAAQQAAAQQAAAQQAAAQQAAAQQAAAQQAAAQQAAAQQAAAQQAAAAASAGTAPSHAVTPTVQNAISAMYIAIFRKSADKSGYQYWLQQMRNAGYNDQTVLTNAGLKTLSVMMISSQLAYFDATYGNASGSGAALSDSNFVQAMYQNCGGLPGEASGVQYWVGLLVGESRANLSGDLVYGMMTGDLTHQPSSLSAIDYQIAVQRQANFQTRIAASVSTSQ